MAVTLQIKDVPADVRDMLADQAARQGRPLQSLLQELLAYAAGTQANADTFRVTADLRVTVPNALRPDVLMRQYREDLADKDVLA